MQPKSIYQVFNRWLQTMKSVSWSTTLQVSYRNKQKWFFKTCMVLFSLTHWTKFIGNCEPPDSAPPPAPPSLPTTSPAPPQWRRSFPQTLPPDRETVCIHEASVCTVCKGCGVLGRVLCDSWDESVWQSGSRRRRRGGLWRCVYLRRRLFVSLFICCCRQGDLFGLEYWAAELFTLFLRQTQQSDLTWNLGLEVVLFLSFTQVANWGTATKNPTRLKICSQHDITGNGLARSDWVTWSTWWVTEA